eukprot:gnl/Chilomastix_cuspidata/6582.p1 GENE.gnl/Chilomastix_cuspidata/6582~~gnl/Chilomastix_cuspidata/6582.p1  ORF type:complete len:345 (+),score=91.44 gnl/Chilomastix_cuspidata/6582:32-1036(+)
MQERAAAGDGRDIISITIGSDQLLDPKCEFGEKVCLIDTFEMKESVVSELLPHYKANLAKIDHLICMFEVNAHILPILQPHLKNVTKYEIFDSHTAALIEPLSGEQRARVQHVCLRRCCGSFAALPILDFSGLRVLRVHDAGAFPGVAQAHLLPRLEALALVDCAPHVVAALGGQALPALRSLTLAPSAPLPAPCVPVAAPRIRVLVMRVPCAAGGGDGAAEAADRASFRAITSLVQPPKKHLTMCKIDISALCTDIGAAAEYVTSFQKVAKRTDLVVATLLEDTYAALCARLQGGFESRLVCVTVTDADLRRSKAGRFAVPGKLRLQVVRGRG